MLAGYEPTTAIKKLGNFAFASLERLLSNSKPLSKY